MFVYTVTKIIVECRNSWHKLRVEHIEQNKWAVYNWFHGAVPYMGTTKDEAIQNYLECNKVGFPIGSIEL